MTETEQDYDQVEDRLDELAAQVADEHGLDAVLIVADFVSDKGNMLIEGANSGFHHNYGMIRRLYMRYKNLMKAIEENDDCEDEDEEDEGLDFDTSGGD